MSEIERRWIDARDGDVRTSWLARRILDRVSRGWTTGRLTVHLPEGATVSVGVPAAEPHAMVWIEDEALFRKFGTRGDLGAGESYMDGDWRTDDLARFLELAIRNEAALPLESGLTKVVNAGHTLSHWCRRNTRAGSRRHIRHHYDLGNEFFALFLDASLTYSCGLFDEPGLDLEAAQRAKFQRFCDWLEIGPDDHLLEIGCGWGAFAIHAARERGCRVDALTISEKQRRKAAERVRAAGLDDRISVRLCDYRDASGRYDKIVSIEMLEAVGRRYWEPFFARCDALLAPGGLLGLQVITVPDYRFESYARHGDWIQTYIFPGGLLPSVGQICRAVQRTSKLTIRRLDDIGDHYATTLKCWRGAFLENLESVRSLGFGERFVRMWEYYLASCEAGFRTRLLGNLQIVMGRAR
jgi:cyclopropane-fatty-acyl-phospholipid synthase